MKILTTICLIFLTSFLAFSQETANFNTALRTSDSQFNISGLLLPGKAIDKNVTGSRYLFSNWNGQYKVISKNGSSRQLLNLNYNLQTNKLESFVSKDSVFQYDLDQFQYIVKQSDKYKVINEGELNGLFLEVFNGEKLKLFKEATLVVQEGVFNPLTQTMMEENTYVQMYTYYVFANGKYEKIKLGKKSIMKYLSDKEDLIKEYVSKNKLTYTTDSDVSKILNHYYLL